VLGLVLAQASRIALVWVAVKREFLRDRSVSFDTVVSIRVIDSA